MSVRTPQAVNVRSTCVPFIGKLNWNHIAKGIPENLVRSSGGSDGSAKLTTGRPAQAYRLFGFPILYHFVLSFIEELHKNLTLDSKDSEILQTKFKCIRLTML